MLIKGKDEEGVKRFIGHSSLCKNQMLIDRMRNEFFKLQLGINSPPLFDSSPCLLVKILLSVMLKLKTSILLPS